MQNVREVYIDTEVADHPVVADICSRLRNYPPIVAAQTVYAQISRAPDAIQKAKQILFLTQNKGAFIRKCPGTRNYTCCDYQILHIGSFCPMDCAYCILQSYFHPPVWQFFVNHEQLFAELEQFLHQSPFRRLGTGEFTDSLIWAPWTDLNQQLVTRFGRQARAVLELKTKTTAIAELQHLAHGGKTILAWSLNTPAVIAELERRTASLAARLEAARQCAAWGYPIAFHFDPLIVYDGCIEDYTDVLQRLFAQVDARRIVWISLGALRFMPDLKPVMEQRFPDAAVTGGEFITGTDGKLRYFKPLRLQLFQHLVAQIREMAPDVCVYFCMEDDEVWQKAAGFLPAERGGLPQMLDQAAVACCGLQR